MSDRFKVKSHDIFEQQKTSVITPRRLGEVQMLMGGTNTEISFFR